jgi:hypothetical protein
MNVTISTLHKKVKNLTLIVREFNKRKVTVNTDSKSRFYFDFILTIKNLIQT